ncbi:sugar ABC transporter permease [Treponema primitia ZAS-2]|uniref:Sugar ABC transporter permease n=1 Tax=Treponema primitia (strain ATCC BAA-887 / DSM 12427 / ZAS-2) TaxID=545694 RepID=F5YQ56_TREPZ|nr:sugar ABC transporter permease [Treponema primitia]AEF86363.1 sugar ABC transporter permease [Treponema primitia ZAS-2]
MKYQLSRKISHYCFILPAFLIFISVMIFPVFFSFVLGFTQWKGYGEMRFVGFDNYIRMFQDPVFHIALRNNILIVLISVFGQIPLGMLLAYMLHRKMVKKSNVFEVLIFLPITISSVIIAQLWNRMFSPVGILPALVRTITGNKDYIITIVENKDLAIIPIMFVLLWQHTSLYMVIFLANLQRIPNSFIEAAQLEGAGEGTIFLKIIMPILGYVIFINSILAIAGSFKSFDLIYSMSGGGPAHYTEVIAVYMYNTTFVHQNYGYGSALSIIIIGFIVLSLLLTRGVSKIFKVE